MGEYTSETLRQSLGALRLEVDGSIVDAIEPHADAMEALERRLAEALAALREHGGHDTECGVWDDDHECTCGLAAALRGEG